MGFSHVQGTAASDLSGSARPLSNPLTATDAGSTATVNIASFAMRVAGLDNISLNSGSITGLDFSTLYYIYHADPTYEGGAVTYLSSTTKEDSLADLGYFFDGSIMTPANGAPDTIGNNDGGSGAQNGSVLVLTPLFVSEETGHTITSPNSAIDGSLSTFASVSLSGVSGAVDRSIITATFRSPTRAAKSYKLKVKSAVTSSLNGGGSTTRASVIASWNLVDGTAGSQTLFSTSTSRSVATDEYDLPSDIDLGTLGISFNIHVIPSDTSGTIEIDAYDAAVEVEV